MTSQIEEASCDSVANAEAGKTGATQAHRRIRRLKTAGIVLVLFLVLATGGAAWYYSHLLGRITYVSSASYTYNRDLKPEDVAEPTSKATPMPPTPKVSAPTETTAAPTEDPTRFDELADISIASDPDVENILLIGVDADSSSAYTRADTIIILSIDNRTDTIRLASILRDNGVIIPGREEYGIDKINHSYAYGGAAMLMNTIEANYRVRIDNYITVGFVGFTRIIDSIGGLDIELTEAEAAAMGLAPGIRHLDGAHTQMYARLRKIDSDFQRTTRQRHVLELVMQKAVGMNLWDLTGLMEALFPLVSTGLTRGEMSALLLRAPALLSYPLQQDSIPLPGSYFSVDYTFHADMPANARHLQSFLYGS